MDTLDIESGLPPAPGRDRSSAGSGYVEYNEGILPYVHYIMFGKGTNFAVPLVIGIIITILQIYIICLSRPIYIVYNIAFLIEILMNIYFGYAMLQTQRLHQILQFTTNTARKQHYLDVLQIICVITYASSWLNVIVILFYPISSKNLGGPITFILRQIICQFFIFINYYLCGVWVWKMYVMYDTYMKDIRPLVSLETYDTFSTRFFQYYERMEIHSKYWRFNHAVRTVTGLYIVILAIYTVFQEFQNQNYFLVVYASTFVFTYYSTIWLTYLGAGFINDRIKKSVLKGISKLKPKQEIDKHNLLLLRNNVQDGFSGMYVSGLHMSTEKAFGIGGTIMTVMILFVKLHYI